MTEYRVRRARLHSPPGADPILERCLDLIAPVVSPIGRGLTEATITKAATGIAVLKKEWHAARRIKASDRFFAALRSAAVQRGVLARADALRHDPGYVSFCTRYREALNLRTRGAWGIAAAGEIMRRMRMLAGVVYVLPEVIPTSDLGLLRRPEAGQSNLDDIYGRELGQEAVCPEFLRVRETPASVWDPGRGVVDPNEGLSAEQRAIRSKQERIAKCGKAVAALLWNEPTPILMDRLNEDMFPLHLEPERPDDSARRDAIALNFLWGRRMVVSLPIEEILGGRLDKDGLWASIQDLARRAKSEQKAARRQCREALAASIRAERARVAAMSGQTESRTAFANALTGLYDEMLGRVDKTYSLRPGKARPGRDRGGSAAMLAAIGHIEDRLGERNRQVGESVRLGQASRQHNDDDRIVDVPDTRSSDSSIDSLDDILEDAGRWLMAHHLDYGLDRRATRRLIQDLLRELRPSD